MHFCSWAPGPVFTSCAFHCLAFLPFFHILHVSLLQTNDEGPYTENTHIQESEHCKVKLYTLPVWTDVRRGTKKQHWLGICFAVGVFDIRQWLGFDERRLTNILFYRLVICLRATEACLSFGLQEIALRAFPLKVQYLVSTVLEGCCVLVLVSSSLFWREPSGLSKLIKETSRWHWEGISR